jgi:hypothetical protein
LSLKFPNAKLEGFDFAPTHFSAKELLPTNVSLNELDILDDIPDQLPQRIQYHRYPCVQHLHPSRRDTATPRRADNVAAGRVLSMDQSYNR